MTQLEVKRSTNLNTSIPKRLIHAKGKKQEKHEDNKENIYAIGRKELIM